MKIQIKPSRPSRSSGDGVPVEKYLECLRRIFEKQGVTHLKSARFSTRAVSHASYVLRQRYSKTHVEELDDVADDGEVVF